MTATMPRLTPIDYVNRRATLREESLERDAYAFDVLSPTEQIALHEYFEPTKNFSLLEALAHRKAVSRRSPNLPHRAGRAFARIRPFLNMLLDPAPAGQPKERSRTWTASDRSVKVISQVQPQIDPEQIARIIIRVAELGPPPEIKRRAGGS